MCPKQSERLEDIQKKNSNASKKDGISEVNEQIVSLITNKILLYFIFI